MPVVLTLSLPTATLSPPGAHELEQMQLILDTVPVLREEDRQELLKVMPSYISQGWEVKRSLRELLPEVDVEGERSISIHKSDYSVQITLH